MGQSTRCCWRHQVIVPGEEKKKKNNFFQKDNLSATQSTKLVLDKSCCFTMWFVILFITLAFPDNISSSLLQKSPRSFKSPLLSSKSLWVLQHLRALPSTGSPCGSGESSVCHLDVVTRIAGIEEYAEVCNNGTVQLMRGLGRGYGMGPRHGRRRCFWEGVQQVCDGDQAPGEEDLLKVWRVERRCKNG